jgi:iron complex transport system substrate-binding protein
MRIVSLVPAGTEIAFALGAGKDVVAVTHDCDFPAEARKLPRVTRSTIASGSDSRAIDTQVRAAAERGESTFHLDAAALAAARPDILLGQTLCAVCAVTIAQVPATIDPTPAVVPLDGDSIEGIVADIERAGVALGRRDAAGRLIAELRTRIAHIEWLVGGAGRRSVACLEWLAPLFNAGHWVPEQVAFAGGRDVLGEPGARSREVTLDDVAAADPDFIVLMPCGFDAARAVAESRALAADPAWAELRAVREGRAYAVDGNAYFSRPGPRVVDGIELLGAILHPDRVQPPTGARAIPLAAAVLQRTRP